jgi:quinol monooxygenase YgiN
VARIGRYAKATAKPGQGEALAAKLLEVARSLRDAPGCELYVINRSRDEQDVVWVTELWESEEHMDAALERSRESIPQVLALVDGFERIDLEPLGGVGVPGGE